jgi:hypothetical protein
MTYFANPLWLDLVILKLFLIEAVDEDSCWSLAMFMVISLGD